MSQILLFIISLVIIIVGFVLVVSQREAKKHGTSTKEEFVGICASAVETASQKEARKGRGVRVLARARRTRQLRNSGDAWSREPHSRALFGRAGARGQS